MGFVKGRNIRDNICLISEANSILNNTSFSSNVVLKFDISKAFDMLSWPFIIKTLESFGFCYKFCNWIMAILNFSFLSIGFNGKQVGFLTIPMVWDKETLYPLFFLSGWIDAK